MPYLTVSGATHHLIGVRESATEHEPLAQPPLESAVLGPPVRRCNSNSSSDISTASTVPGGDTLVADVLVEGRLPLRGVTAGFRDAFHVDNLNNPCLSDFLRPSDAEALVAWMAGWAERVLGEEMETPRIEAFGRVYLRQTPESPGPEGPCQQWRVRVCFPPPVADEEGYRASVRLSPCRCSRGSVGRGTPATTATESLAPTSPRTPPQQSSPLEQL